MECKIRAVFFRKSFKLHLSPFEREGIKQWIGSNRSGDTLGGKREWAASMASWRSEKRAFVLSRGGGGGELGLEEEEEVESLAGGGAKAKSRPGAPPSGCLRLETCTATYGTQCMARLGKVTLWLAAACLEGWGLSCLALLPLPRFSSTSLPPPPFAAAAKSTWKLLRTLPRKTEHLLHPCASLKRLI